MKKPTSAHLIAFVALFVALGGTSYAALKIPRNSVASRQVKDGSLVPADLNASARSDLYIKSSSAQVSRDKDAGEYTALTLKVPKGKYLISADASLWKTNAASQTAGGGVNCAVFAGSKSLRSETTWLPEYVGGGIQGTHALDIRVAVSLSSTRTLALKCGLAVPIFIRKAGHGNAQAAARKGHAALLFSSISYEIDSPVLTATRVASIH